MESTLITADQWRRHIVDSLSPRYGLNEARWMARIIFSHLKGWDTSQFLLNSDNPLDRPTTLQINTILNEMATGRPIQYVLGSALFFGMEFHVTPDVLIPRPETEQLVQLVIDTCGHISDATVADIGSGSGCIAIALARNLRFSQVTAVDISPAAVEVARENCRRLNCRNVNVVCADALTLANTPQLFAPHSLDIVVSNPPYIARSEAGDMEEHVLNHEPHTALFVPDSNPLLFYTAIARFALHALRPGAHLFFEINPLFAKQLTREIISMGFSEVTTISDSFGKTRFLTACHQ